MTTTAASSVVLGHQLMDRSAAFGTRMYGSSSVDNGSGIRRCLNGAVRPALPRSLFSEILPSASRYSRCLRRSGEVRSREERQEGFGWFVKVMRVRLSGR